MSEAPGHDARSRRGLAAFKRELLNVPNAITIGRLFLIPPVIALIEPADPLRNLAAALLFALASGLDILDGWLARRQGLVTVFGKFVDPLADKLMAMAVMIFLVEVELLPAWLVVLMLGRDLYINGLRTLAAERGLVMAAGSGGKIKTAVQLIGICFVLLRHAYPVPGLGRTLDFPGIGRGLLYVATGLSLWSAWQYTLEFGRVLRASSHDGD